MALSLSYDCPHCDTKRAGFTFLTEAPAKENSLETWNVLFGCNVCFMPVVAVLDGFNYYPSTATGNILAVRCEDLEFFPKASPAVAPEHVPERVANAFLQAEQSLRARHWDASGAMDRRALEIATKEQAPDRAGDTLYKRIEYLASIGKLTQSLKEWAHSLRLIGNDAVHDEDGLDETEARQAHDLTKFILIYLYTLPKQVALAQAAREGS